MGQANTISLLSYQSYYSCHDSVSCCSRVSCFILKFYPCVSCRAFQFLLRVFPSFQCFFCSFPHLLFLFMPLVCLFVVFALPHVSISLFRLLLSSSMLVCVRLYRHSIFLQVRDVTLCSPPVSPSWHVSGFCSPCFFSLICALLFLPFV